VLSGRPDTGGSGVSPDGGVDVAARDGASVPPGVDASSPGVDASPPRDASNPPPDASSPPPGQDAGATGLAYDGGDLDAEAPVCTSGVMWTLGNSGSAEMQPGNACITCHVLGGAASGYPFDVAGTVYPTAHEPNECDGTMSASIVITDSKQKVHTLQVNSAGNFYNFDYLGVGAIPTPFTVKVVLSGNERPMLTPVTNGDCNSCHTQQGLMGAPGRVTTP